MIELVVAALVVFAGLAWNELREWMPWLARKLLIRAVTALPEELRTRMTEELTAELAAIPGKISPFVFACSIWWSFSSAAVLARLDAKTSQYVLRATDYVLAALLIFFTLPTILITLAVTSLSSGTPGLRRIKCTGRGGVPFQLVRFQVRDAKTGKVTKTGEVVLRLRLDRLPEIFNVLRGEMSLVGPRPKFGRHVSGFEAAQRPGIIWTPSEIDGELEGFGTSSVATIRIYFRLIWNDLRNTLFPRP